MHGESVWTVDLSGRRTKVLDVSGRRPSGLGFLPDGDLLIVSMLEAELLRWDGTDLTTYADFTPFFVKGCNDMIVDMNATSALSLTLGVRSAASSPWTQTGRRVSLQTR
jgi:sugar lactone lactonase YvrE